ncbi:MAG: adenylate kinase [Acidobacteriota bacterium]
MSFGRVVILLGAPGAGKGTQAKLLAESRGYLHVSTGDLLRQAVRQGSELGKRCKAIMEAGGLVPDELVSQLVEEKNSAGDADSGMILDGYPRNLAQAEFLSGVLNGVRPKTIQIRVDEDQVVKRLSGRRTCSECGRIFNVFSSPSGKGGKECEACGGELLQREDDREEAIRERLRIYRRQTAPLVEHYSSRGDFFEVDGNRSVNEVAAEIARLSA